MKFFDHGSRDSDKIALTFDDGPNPFWTMRVLDILDKYSVSANFFVLGKWAEIHCDIVKDAYKRGHLIGNHGYSHQKNAPAGFEEAEAVISGITKENTKFIRPPYFDISMCADYGPAQNGRVAIANADMIVGDWKSTAGQIFASIAAAVQNGSIIVLHDGSQKEWELKKRPAEMVNVLPAVIEKLKEKFEIVRLDAMDAEFRDV